MLHCPSAEGISQGNATGRVSPGGSLRSNESVHDRPDARTAFDAGAALKQKAILPRVNVTKYKGSSFVCLPTLGNGAVEPSRHFDGTALTLPLPAQRLPPS